MDEFIARLNIAHLQKRLAEDTIEAERKVIMRLLAQEEATLAQVLADRNPKKVKAWGGASSRAMRGTDAITSLAPFQPLESVAWKHQAMRAAPVDHGQQQVPLKMVRRLGLTILAPRSSIAHERKPICQRLESPVTASALGPLKGAPRP